MFINTDNEDTAVTEIAKWYQNYIEFIANFKNCNLKGRQG